MEVPTQAPERVERFALIRPIRVSDSNTQRDFLDRTYPYGDTQGGTRQAHSGVEFVNPTGTTVLAAEDGRVVFAGTDDTTLIGPRNGFYGNVVVIEHDELQSPSGERVYTVYGHLSRILVVNDGIITRGMPIGEVGDSGIAVGPHLHFEVRVGPDPFDYNATRNPDLWLRPYAGSGVLAGRVTDGAGQLLPGVAIDIRSVRTNNLLFAFTYAPDTVNSDIAWQENFTRGDLPAGQYIVTVAQEGDVRFQQRVTIEDQKITWLDIVLE
jgi:murein DD-endopeptidase MepM/ murein hydrolase activator NlpD